MSDISRLRRQIYVMLIVGAVAAVSGRIFNLQQAKLRNVDLYPTHGSNDRSRWATVRALVDQQSYVIGQRTYVKDQRPLDAKASFLPDNQYEDTGIIVEDGWKTVDKVLNPETEPGTDGKVKYFYSSKPPLFPTIVSGEYWLLKQLGLSMSADLAWIVRIILLTVNVLPLAIYLFLLGRLADQFGGSEWGRLFLVFAAGFATFVTSFGNTLNNHTVATYLTLFGLTAFLRIWSGTAPEPATVVPKTAPPPVPPPEPKAPAVAESKPVEPEKPASEAVTETPASPTPPVEEPAGPAAEGSAFAGLTAPALTAEKPPETPAAAEKEESNEKEEAEVFTSFRMGESASAGEAGPPSSSAVMPPVRLAGAGSFFAAGLFTSLAAALELPALAFTAIAFALLLVRDRSRTLRFFLPPALLVAGLFFLTNYLALGRLIPAYAESGAKTEWYNYRGSHWWQDPEKPPKTGIDFADEDKLTYAMHFLIGHHGVFALSPIFLLSLAGIAVILWRRRQFDGSQVALAGITAVLTLVVIGFYIYKTNNYAGFSSGPRWVMWLTPFWLLTLLPVADKLSSCRWGRTLALTLLGLSILSASYPAWIPWQHPWIYRYVEELGWMKY